MEIKVCNVNEALSRGLDWLRVSGVLEDSRNGQVLVSPEPVLTEYRFPMERVLFSPRRDANPFFHLMEALWMIAGRNDVEWPKYFNSKFDRWSDDGITVHGAYGRRWRMMDQLHLIAKELEERPNTRRAVLAMWLPGLDLNRIATGKDVPCNTHVYFELKDGLLNQTVCCRSNDILWGAYGANAVHMSILQEYVAALAHVHVGVYRQFSNNYHLYLSQLPEGSNYKDELFGLSSDVEENDHYKYNDRDIQPSPVINIPIADWENDLNEFFQEPLGERVTFVDPFFSECAVPMYRAWTERKLKYGNGLKELERMDACFPDWYRVCREWIERREARKHGQL